MSLRSPEELAAFDGEWVNIYNTTTGGLHTCTKEAFDTFFGPQGWVIATDEQVSAELQRQTLAGLSPTQQAAAKLIEAQKAEAEKEESTEPAKPESSGDSTTSTGSGRTAR